MIPHFAIELLDTRIAPAAVFTFTDVDGDFVTVKTSKGTSDQLEAILKFVDFGDGQQLQTINFSLDETFVGSTLSITAKRVLPGGDGLVNVGYVNANNTLADIQLNLGAISIQGDLGQIDSGSSIAGLNVKSMGIKGITTQEPAGNLVSSISGSLGFLKVAGDVENATFYITGTLGPVTIGDSLIGVQANLTGLISATGGIGKVTVGGSIDGGSIQIDGGLLFPDVAMGTLTVKGSIANASVTVAGNLGAVKVGGFIEDSAINALGSVASLTIGDSLTGTTINARGFGAVKVTDSITESSLFGTNDFTSLAVGGSILDCDFDLAAKFIKIGGDVENANFDVSFATSFGVGGFFLKSALEIDGSIGAVKIGGDFDASKIWAGDRIASVTIGGSVIGGASTDSGKISSNGSMGPIKIGGDLKGGAGQDSGQININNTLASVTIGGSIIGTSNLGTGKIFSQDNMGPIKVGVDVIGGSGHNSAFIYTSGSIASINVGGSILGGSGPNAGGFNSATTIGAIKVGGDIKGDSGSGSGQIVASGKITSIHVVGSLLGGSNNYTGRIVSDSDIGKVTIGGDIKGGDIDSAANRVETGFLLGKRIGSLYVGGSIISGTESNGGTLVDSGSVRAGLDIGAITIKGSLHGNATNPVLITAQGQLIPGAKSDVAIKSLSVGGNVDYAEILAGYDISGTPEGTNADAQIGAVSVNGDWTASSLIAGAQDNGDATHDDFFGNGDDTKIVGVTDTSERISKIARILIKGEALASVSGSDHFGFVAQHIGSLKVNGSTIALTPGESNDVTGIAIDATDDLRVREVAL